MKDILTVSQLNDNIKTFLEESFGVLWVEGKFPICAVPSRGMFISRSKTTKARFGRCISAPTASGR